MHQPDGDTGPLPTTGDEKKKSTKIKKTKNAKQMEPRGKGAQHSAVSNGEI